MGLPGLAAAVAACALAGAGGSTPARQARVAVVAAGDCADAALLGAARDLRSDLARSPEVEVVGEDDTLAVGGPASPQGVDAVMLAIESGKTDFLNLKLARAEASLRTAAVEADGLPLGPQRWQAWWTARVNLARLLQYQEQRARASEVFLEILRVQEDFQLNRVEYPPSLRDLLDLTRSLLTGMPRYALRVTSAPAGQTVYVNGFALGKTPLERRMVGATYQVIVGEEGRRGLLRRVALTADVAIEVDLARESRFAAAAGPCFAVDGDADRLGAATALGRALRTERVVVVHRSSAGFSASAVDAARAKAIGELALPASGGADPQPLVAWLQRVPIARPDLPGAGPDSTFAAAEGGAPPPPASGAPRWARPTAWALAATAVVLAGVTAYQHTQVADLEDSLADLVVPGTVSVRSEDLPRKRELDAQLESARSRRTVWLAATGVAAAGAGAMFAVTLLASPSDGAVGASVQGRF